MQFSTICAKILRENMRIHAWNNVHVPKNDIENGLATLFLDVAKMSRRKRWNGLCDL